MSKRATFNESDQTVATSTSIQQPSPMLVARFVSNILSPAIISLPLVFLIALYHASSSIAVLSYTCITLFFLSIGPLLYIVIGVRLGKFTDIDVSVRSQRTGPFIFGLASSLVGLLILALAHGPKNLQTLLLITLLSGSVMMIITFWWKISLHSSSVASAVTILAILYGTVVLPAYLLVIAVGWSRVVLRRHTIAQVVAGALLSTVLTVLIVTIRNI